MNTQLDKNLLQALKWRCIGPPRGGRVVAVAGHPTDPMVCYFGACAGGVWKSTDGGTYWENVSDGFFSSAAIGALAVSQSDPNIIYAGTGETTIRTDVSYGDGIYKSTDGGKTWSHAGLRETRHVGKIRIHPEDPDLVYVAALGHAFGPNEERGVFRSRDGGTTWEKVLFRSEKAGAVDLSMDPGNPRILFTAVWEAYRTFWTLSSGGPDSGLYRSTDGGDNWTEITDYPGLPAGIKGKAGVSVSPARTGRVWALVEAEEAGLYRSDDGGDTWERTTDNRDLFHRPWYYCHVYADPQDADTVYVLDYKMWKSTDGGVHFDEISTPHGDNHDLWIDPSDPRHMVEGNDGGACVSFNGGKSWSTIYNQLTSQFYRLDTDNRFPYRVYATQQDNSSISVPSATHYGVIPWTECRAVGTGESGFMAVHPEDPEITYIGAVGSSPGGGGALQRYDHRTRQLRLVTVWPEAYVGWGVKDLKYRFNWTFPIVFSPHDANVLYTACNVVFRSTDEGGSWEVISPDLTRNDNVDGKLEASGGPLTKDCSAAEHYATIYTFVESPHEQGTFWAGSDDGLIHISRNGARTWENVTPPGLPEWTLISVIEASPHAPGTAYVAATRYKLDEYRAFLYRTEDYGRTWHDIGAAFPVGEISRVVREDPVRPGLLYVGTETGICFSLDNGQSWQRLQTNLPVVPVYDIKVKEGDLVAATHGRSFWILDDLTPLRRLPEDASQAPAHLFAPRPTCRLWQQWEAVTFDWPNKTYMPALGTAATFYQIKTPEGESIRKCLDAGENPPPGAIIYYLLKEAPTEPLALRILDARGREIRAFSSAAGDGEKDGNERYAPAAPGLNRFVWDMHYPGAEKVPGDLTTEEATTGPLAAPGTYQVELKVGDRTWTQSFEIYKDPRVGASQEDLQAQFELWSRISAKVGETHKSINQLRRIKRQTGEWTRRAGEMDGMAETDAGAIRDAAKTLGEKLEAIEKELIQTEVESRQDFLRLPVRLNAKLVSLLGVLASADEAPTRQAYQVFDHLSAQIDAQIAQLQNLIDVDVAAFNELVGKAGVPPIAT